MRTGFDEEGLRVLTGWDHCVQSIGVLMRTRVGSIIMRGAVGSRVPDLQDRNPDPTTIMVMMVGLAKALREWEPGFRLRRIVPRRVGPDGVYAFDLAGDFYPDGHLGDYRRRETQAVAVRTDGVTVLPV